MEKNKKIKILGAGISGLTAAITLAKAGIDVEVYEKNADCGMRFHGDMQGLENWSSDIDVLSEMTQMSLEINFDQTPFHQVTFSDSKTTKELSFVKPLFYLISRGNHKGSIDIGLKEQAITAGATILFNTSIDEIDADIVAFGPHPKIVPVADKGIIFDTALPDMAEGLINDLAAYKGYSYLLIANGKACLCSCTFGDVGRLTENFEYTKKYFIQKYDLKIGETQDVGGIGYFSLNNKYQRRKRKYIGEAAGIQDGLAGFGMRTAMQSGYLAAASIIEGKNYGKMARGKFTNYIKAGIVNRFIWEHLNPNFVNTFLFNLKEFNPEAKSVKSLYHFNFIGKLIYPIALRYIKKHYPEIV